MANIGIIVANLGIASGGYRVINKYATGLQAKGHNVSFWQENIFIKQYYSDSIPVQELDLSSIDNLDVVIVTDMLYLPKVIKASKKVKVVVLIQHDDEWINKALGRPTLNDSSYKPYFQNKRVSVIVVSEWLKAVIERRFDITKIIVIENGVDTSDFYPAKPLIASDYPSVLFMYDAQAWKGNKEIIDALAYVRQTIPNLQVYSFGRYLPITGDNTMAFDFPLTFFQLPDQHLLRRIYASGDVFISASWKEGFGLTVLEAMACGRPVITYQSEGMKDIVKDNGNVIILNSLDSYDIANTITSTLHNKKLRDRLGRNALKTAEQRTWNISLNKLYTLIDA